MPSGHTVAFAPCIGTYGISVDVMTVETETDAGPIGPADQAMGVEPDSGPVEPSSEPKARTLTLKTIPFPAPEEVARHNLTHLPYQPLVLGVQTSTPWVIGTPTGLHVSLGAVERYHQELHAACKAVKHELEKKLHRKLPLEARCRA
eukprot:5508223-Amphidinium_carterae.1